MVAFLKLGSTSHAPSQLPFVRCVPRNAVCSPTCVWERFGRLLLFLYKPSAASAHRRERAPPPGPVGVGKGGAPSQFCRVCPSGCGSSVYDFILRCRRPLTNTTERLRNSPPLPSPRLWDKLSCGAGETAAPRAVPVLGRRAPRAMRLPLPPEPPPRRVSAPGQDPLPLRDVDFAGNLLSHPR